jgi:Holliday junction resolvase RusA-like endonuclease
MIRFFASGTPKSMSVGKSVRVPVKGRPGSFQQFQTRSNTEWSVIVGAVGRAHAPAAPLEGALVLVATFYVPMPTTMPKRDRHVAMPTKRPDIDNLMHKFSDHWNGIFWHDDSQLVDLLARKRYSLDGRTGVEIIVAPVTNANVMAQLDQVVLDLEPARS